MTEIYGNDSLLESLRNAACKGQVSHSYILNGADGTGKLLIARYFARLLQCTGEEKPCGHCLSCLQALSGHHPDIIEVGHEKPNLFGVDDVRTGINQTVQVRPYSSPYKVYILDEAEKMNQQAQNALLKTIEEPPDYVVILLLTSNAESFLETIRSRCVRLDVRPLPEDFIEELLLRRGAEKQDAVRAARLSGGSLGKTFSMLESEPFRKMSELTFGILRDPLKLTMKDIHAFLGEMGKLREETENMFSLMELWFRDVMVMKAGKGEALLLFREEQDHIRAQAARMSYAGTNRVFDEISHARECLNANVNYELTLELLLIAVKECAEGR